MLEKLDINKADKNEVFDLWPIRNNDGLVAKVKEGMKSQPNK